MPVSHLGLTVSHVASATSFYLAALQPLGYRYIGQQGDAVGLGVNDADFFLSQARNGARVSPTHIAFAAKDRLTVRDCYAAALNAGGRPSGSPGYRNDDCSCFNAAAEDLDGNTIEFIFREPQRSIEEEHHPAPSAQESDRNLQKSIARNGNKDHAQSLSAYASKAESRVQTALDLASSTAKSTKNSGNPNPGISRSRTEPVASMTQNGGKTIVGTLLGAAAGAAFAYAMTQSERDSAREEAAFASSMRSKDVRSRGSQEKSTASKKSYRNGNESDPARGSRQNPRSMRAIEAPPYDDLNVQDVLTRYRSSSRPTVRRSKTYDAVDPAIGRSDTGRGDRFSIKRASTMPLNTTTKYIDAPSSKSASRSHSRRGSFNDSSLKRHDSGISTSSRYKRRSSSDKASTAKPPRRNSWQESAANVPLPSSRATTRVTGGDAERTYRASKTPSYATAAQVPLPKSRTASYISAAGYNDEGEDSDGLGDMQSVVPDDSISCVDFSRRTKSKGSKALTNTSKRSEPNSERTVRPAKHAGSRHSARTLPTRRKDDTYSNRRGKRSTATYA